MANPPPPPPPPPPPNPDAEIRRRRRGRNIAMLVVLFALAGLFYAIAIVKLGRPTVGG